MPRLRRIDCSEPGIRRVRRGRGFSYVGADGAPIRDREVLTRRYDELAATWAGREIPLPPFWGGYRLAPATIELWQGRADRLHDRLRYTRELAGGWRLERLAP